MSNHDRPQSKPVEVFGDQHSRDTRLYTDPAYLREIHTQPVTFTCVHCGQTVTQERYPSPLMKRKAGYCSDQCRREAKAERSRLAMQRLRERRKAENA